MSRGYVTKDQGLKPGMAVSLVSEGMVERADSDTADKAIGIAQSETDSNIVFSSDQASLLVEISGEASVFVTDYNGSVAAGDNLTISPIKGVLMKASQSDDVFGVALADMPDNGEEYTIETNQGNKTAKVAKTSISLDRKGFAGTTVLEDDSSLRKLGKAVAGKDIGELRVVVALVIFFLVMIAEGGIIYGAVSSSITSLGRNPMAKEIIKRELIRVVGIALIVLTIGVAAVYAILRV